MAALFAALAVLAALAAVLARLLVLADRQIGALAVRVGHQADRIRALRAEACTWRAEARSRADAEDLLTAACDRLTARVEQLRDELDALTRPQAVDLTTQMTAWLGTLGHAQDREYPR